MSERTPKGAAVFSGRRTAFLTGGVILALALGSLLFPAHQTLGSRAALLVFDPGCGSQRVSSFYKPLGQLVAEAGDLHVEVKLVRDQGAFAEELARTPEFVLCPDGVGLRLPTTKYLPLVVGRRAAPRNLRPRSVLIYRKTRGFKPTPWIEFPGATIIGDSLSLVGTGAWRRHDPLQAPAHGRQGPTFGPDPFDHGPVLHALRLGCFDFAVVRQWDADRFFDSGLLSHQEWGQEVLSPPVPDLMLFVARKVSPQRRLAIGDHLSALGRNPDGSDARWADLVMGLAMLRLVGFNILVEPDLDVVRRNFPGHWPDQNS